MKSIALLLLSLVTGTLLYSQSLHWKAFPQAAVREQAAAVASPGFPDRDWVPAIVPGTVFYAYVKAGLEKDPDYADNIYQVDAAKYNRPFWYRTEFPAIAVQRQQRVWLKFNGINKYADIYFNGKHLGNLHGHMQRGSYDITSLLHPKGKNAIAVLISPPKYDPAHDHGLANWESPTYICSGSWDWMPAVPGLNSGITDTVAITVTGPVSIADPWIRTHMPDTSAAAITVSARLTNASPA
ncbi:MAG TPA: sugar-binding domain-containing protein, partial [Chitinophaga sp.]|uniref:glycosyl hydrolase 2 galactose-binding domain-containing protein n=1 Tax=Chitinophaga sp. TaxID=1869181 RepID=UPI002F954803